MYGNADLVRVGIIVKPHGIRGELNVKPLTDFPIRFHDLSQIFMIPKNDGESVSAKIESARIHKNIVLLKLDICNTIQEAQAAIGFEICITREECIKLPPDFYYIFDLVGLQVLCSKGKLLGIIVDALTLPAQDLLIVKKENGKKVMIPFVSEIVSEISIDKKCIVVQDFPGLFDLEQGE